MKDYREQALLEYNSAECSPHPGGVDGRPFWNINSSQFMFAPILQFPNMQKGKKFRYTLKDVNGNNHTFIADTPSASLAPVWSEIPEGFVELKVEAFNGAEELLHVVGMRTFYKCAPFLGRSAYPKNKCSYRECALKALRYVYEDHAVQYFLTHGVPEPDYPHNVYPAKTISSILKAMIAFSKLEPEKAESAMKLARNAADYLLSISFPEGHPLAFLPPTYSFKGLNAESVNKVAPAAWDCRGTTMMIYPVSAALAYLELYDAIKDKKYLDAALCIAEYFKENVLPCGSWYLLYDCETGKPLSNNICVDFNFVKLFNILYKKTGDKTWKSLSEGCYKYIAENCLKTYNWEGQFEDIKVSGNYHNLTHFTADLLIGHITDNLSSDEKMVSEAIDLMRYVEDQFVLWGEYPNWKNDLWVEENCHTPAGLEQYSCYAPIDGSTASIISAFIDMYRLTKNRLYLEKAMTLGNTITRVQNEKTGQIPTFLIGENQSYGYVNFWINSQIGTAKYMMKLAEIVEAEGIE